MGSLRGSGAISARTGLGTLPLATRWPTGAYSARSGGKNRCMGGAFIVVRSRGAGVVLRARSAHLRHGLPTGAVALDRQHLRLSADLFRAPGSAGSAEGCASLGR